MVRTLPHIRAKELGRERKSLEVFAFTVEMEVGLSEKRVAVRYELGHRTNGDDVQTVFRGKRGVCAMKARIHFGLVESELLQTLVPGRIAPGLLHDDPRLRRKFANLRNKTVAERMISRRLPAEVARLLDRHDVPLVENERIGDVGLPPHDHLHALCGTIEAVGLERRIRRFGRCDHVVPVAFKRASADVEGGKVELEPHGLRDMRHLLQVADREAVPDHQYLDGLFRVADVPATNGRSKD